VPVDSGWTFAPIVLLALAAYLGIYVWRWRISRAEGGPRAAPVGKLILWITGIACLFIALVSPVDRLGEQLASMHMVQHLLIADLAPIALTLALTKHILRPATRKAWLAQHPLPRELRYYSLVTLPQPERISSALTSSYDKLARIDGRNDSQVIFYDQVVPGSALVGYVNADHWALAVPIARTHIMVSALFVNRNDYPREALMEALLRFVEEDLASAGP